MESQNLRHTPAEDFHCCGRAHPQKAGDVLQMSSAWLVKVPQLMGDPQSELLAFGETIGGPEPLHVGHGDRVDATGLQLLDERTDLRGFPEQESPFHHGGSPRGGRRPLEERTVQADGFRCKGCGTGDGSGLQQPYEKTKGPGPCNGEIVGARFLLEESRDGRHRLLSSADLDEPKGRIDGGGNGAAKQGVEGSSPAGRDILQPMMGPRYLETHVQ